MTRFLFLKFGRIGHKNGPAASRGPVFLFAARFRLVFEGCPPILRP